MTKKALVMFSGGLDSILAVKLLESQGISCTALTFCTPFFDKQKAEIMANKFGIKIMTVDVSDSHFEMLKNPKYGYGKNMNPCIDCHGFMFRTAQKIADTDGFQILASGEVLGQRPMSQNSRALNAVNKLAGTEILRPLCAQLLPETSYEKLGLVDRNQLLDISGRGRHRQLALAKKFGLHDFEMPGGGCLLTQEGYSQKLKSLLTAFPDDVLSIDTEIIKHGRLKIFSRGFATMGRDDESNQNLINLKPTNSKYKIIHLKETTGPVILAKILDEKQCSESDLELFYREKVQKLKNFPKISFEYK